MNNNQYTQNYLNWLKSNIDEYQVTETISRMTIPFQDRNNDFLDIYIIKENSDKYLLTDDGATLADLALSGFDIFSSDKRTKLFYSVLNSFGIDKDEDDALYTFCAKDNLPLKKHLLTQCMLKVDDMFLLSKANVRSIFQEDVQDFLDQNNISYVQDVLFSGKSKFQSRFDFVIGKTKQKSEKIIKVSNQLEIQNTRNILFSWNDIKDVRPKNSCLYVMINDEVPGKISNDAIRALKEYEVTPILWKDRNNYIEMLSA
ncbi:DUF1829 domain-containing protein [Clostridiales bacterium COT073_COT-073]|nr:DUF1829 domain-containing protein [Clostridiales bacterium COT073_COT-073]